MPHCERLVRVRGSGLQVGLGRPVPGRRPLPTRHGVPVRVSATAWGALAVPDCRCLVGVYPRVDSADGHLTPFQLAEEWSAYPLDQRERTLPVVGRRRIMVESARCHHGGERTLQLWWTAHAASGQRATRIMADEQQKHRQKNTAQRNEDCQWHPGPGRRGRADSPEPALPP